MEKADLAMQNGTIKVIRYSPEWNIKWNDFIQNAQNATFLLHRDYMDYHADRFKDHSALVLNENDDIKAVLPANEDNKKIISHQGLTYGSLIVDRSTKLVEFLNYMALILQYYESYDFTEIIYKCIPQYYENWSNSAEKYAHFLLKSELVKLETDFAFDKSMPSTLQNRRLRSIKRAKKQKVVIVEDEGFKTYWEKILVPNLKSRFNAKPVHNLKEITLLGSMFPNNIKQYSAYLNNKIVAGTTVYIEQDVVKTQYISANEEGKRSGALDYLFYHLIHEEFKEKRYFSFGTTNGTTGLELNNGLVDWKEGYGTRIYTNATYKAQISNYSFILNLIDTH